MIKRICKVMTVHVIVLLTLSTCTSPAEAYVSEDPFDNTQEVIAEQLMTKTDDFTRQYVAKVVTKYEKQQEQQALEKQQVLEQQQAEEEQHAVEESGKEEEFYWDGEVITPSSGVANGPSGYETYYNLPMGGVVSIMRGLGYDEVNYPYWVRDDGCKMLGSYIMVAANLDVRPYGTILPCSRGIAIVCDTGTFAASNPYQLDIAVSW